MLGIKISFDIVDIMNIVVKKDFRQSGIGCLLLEKLIDIAKQKCFNKIMLEVNEKNIPAKNLYLKYNFKPISIRKKYYNNENALIMSLDI